MDECHKLLTNKVDLSNPEGHQIPQNINEPLPLGGPPGQVTIQPQFFFNKDLDYLLTCDKERKCLIHIQAQALDGTLTRDWKGCDKWFKDFHLFEYYRAGDWKWSEDDIEEKQSRKDKDLRIYRSLECFVAVSSSLRLLEPKCTIESRAKRSSINLVRTQHPSETMVFHNEDGNPARANIKQALGRIFLKMELRWKFPSS
ncbi:hypothetical protein Tco_0138271 [Tanacetum coccineum]